VALLRSALLGLVCLAVLAADANATTLCIAADGSAAIERARDGRCDGCEDRPLAPTPVETRSLSDLRDATCRGCLDVDVAGVDQAARRDLELARLTVLAVAPVLAQMAPLVPSPAPRALRSAPPGGAGSAALARSSVLRC
jgi:hypothetical protein